MTDNEFNGIVAFIESDHVLSNDQASALALEAERARASEEAKAERVKFLEERIRMALKMLPNRFNGVARSVLEDSL